MRISLSQDKPGKVVVYGEYDDSNEYAEISTASPVNIYTGKLKAAERRPTKIMLAKI